MTPSQEKQYIVEQRALGVTFTQIGKQLGKSENTVRSIFNRIMAGTEKTTVPQGDAKERLPVEIGQQRCRCCGKPIERTGSGTRRRFCSERCRYAWKNEKKRTVPYGRVCEGCGREFTAFGNPNKRFCSRQCFEDSRREARDE